MPLIKRREVVVKKNISVSIDEKLVAQLDAYKDYTNVDRSEIVEAAIRHAIEVDKDFLQSQFNTPVIHKPVEHKRKSGEKAA